MIAWGGIAPLSWIVVRINDTLNKFQRRESKISKVWLCRVLPICIKKVPM